MHSHSMDRWQHEHVFLGVAHTRNEQRIRIVVALTLVMMVGEIIAGSIFGSMALLADGWHMATHAGALSVSAAAYAFARSRARDARYVFGTGKVGDLAGFTSAVILGGVACLIGFEAFRRLLNPTGIRFDEAIFVAVLGLVVNLVSAFLLNGEHEDDHHQHDESEHHGHEDHNYNSNDNLFGNSDITRVHLTPPSALEFVLALEFGKPMGCINCKDCGYPHLDLGDFARKAHSKHLCGNCGRDNTWSREPIASTPLKPLHDQFSRANRYVDVVGRINLDDYAGLPFQVWASTPAVLWTAHRDQERGIHVHVYKDGKYVVDDTFGTVIYRGEALQRNALFETMAANTIH